MLKRLDDLPLKLMTPYRLSVVALSL